MKTECFVLDSLPPAEAFATFRMRKESHPTLLSIFLKLFSPEIVQQIFEKMGDYIDVGWHKNGQTLKRYKVCRRKIYRTIALSLVIIAEQEKSVEVRDNGHFLRKRVTYAKGVVEQNSTVGGLGREQYEAFLARVAIGCNSEDTLNDNFVSILSTIGENCAGDEKLFYFSGNSGDIRKCPQKADKIGLWFYQLCCSVAIGEKTYPYLMHAYLGKNGETTTCVKQVSTWMDAMWKVSDTYYNEKKLPETNPHPKSYIVYDSLYTNIDGGHFMMNHKQKFMGSCNPQRFQSLISRIHKEGMTDVIGETKSVYKEETGELFTFHNDRQKGVGKKYNYSWGLTRCTQKEKIKQNSETPPGYGYYKFSFEKCDRFNRNLHDHTWPHKRGGRAICGDTTKVHDFFFACIIENSLTAYSAINQLKPDRTAHCTLLTQLAKDLYEYSDTIMN